MSRGGAEGGAEVEVAVCRVARVVASDCPPDVDPRVAGPLTKPSEFVTEDRGADRVPDLPWGNPPGPSNLSLGKSSGTSDGGPLDRVEDI